MGLFDKLKDKASTIASDAAKSVGEFSEKASSITSELADRARTGYDDMMRNASSAMDEWKDKSQNLKQWSETIPDKLQEYASDFNVDDMWKKIESWGAKCGQDLLIMVLTMYYTIEKSIPNLKKQKEK